MKHIAQYCISKFENVFKSQEIYSITTNEFLLVIKDERDESVNIKIFNYLQHFAKSTEIEGYLFKIIIKIGLIKYDGVKIDPIELFNKARIAADQGNDKISGCFIYDNEYEEKRKLANEISGSLFNAIAKNELYLVFQPVIDIRNNCISSGETLIRWNRGERQPVGPNIFIPIAEETGSIKLLTKWILIQSLNSYLSLKEKGLDIKFSINITANELLDDSFIKWAKDFISSKEVKDLNFGIEITERVLSKNNKKINEILSRLQKKGFIIEIDDFGTGYNSLMTISEIPYDIIKIDKYFIDRIHDESIKLIIEHIINACHEIGGQVIAEGVETKEQYMILKQLDCDKIQGYYFSKPLSLTIFMNIVLLLILIIIFSKFILFNNI